MKERLWFIRCHMTQDNLDLSYNFGIRWWQLPQCPPAWW